MWITLDGNRPVSGLHSENCTLDPSQSSGGTLLLRQFTHHSRTNARARSHRHVRFRIVKFRNRIGVPLVTRWTHLIPESLRCRWRCSRRSPFGRSSPARLQISCNSLNFGEFSDRDLSAGLLGRRFLSGRAQLLAISDQEESRPLTKENAA